MVRCSFFWPRSRAQPTHGISRVPNLSHKFINWFALAIAGVKTTLSTGVFGTAESRALPSSIYGMQWPLTLTVKSVFPAVAGKSDFEDYVVALRGMDEA